MKKSSLVNTTIQYFCFVRPREQISCQSMRCPLAHLFFPQAKEKFEFQNIAAHSQPRDYLNNGAKNKTLPHDLLHFGSTSTIPYTSTIGYDTIPKLKFCCNLPRAANACRKHCRGSTRQYIGFVMYNQVARATNTRVTSYAWHNAHSGCASAPVYVTHLPPSTVVGR